MRTAGMGGAHRGTGVRPFVHKARKGQPVQAVLLTPAQGFAWDPGRFCYVHYWSNLNIKDTLARLRLNQDPARGITWEVPDDIPEEYLASDGERATREGEEHLALEADRQATEPLL